MSKALECRRARKNLRASLQEHRDLVVGKRAPDLDHEAHPDSSKDRTSTTPASHTRRTSVSERWYVPPKDPSPSSSRTAAGPRARNAARSSEAFGSAGSSTPASRVQEKFSIHEACAAGSISRTAAAASGPIHQSWKIACAPSFAAIHSFAACRAGMLPPCPLTSRTRRKPCTKSESSSSRTTRRYVSALRLGLPG